MVHDKNVTVEDATSNCVNGMGDITLPDGDIEGSGDMIVKKKKVRKFSEIIKDEADAKDDELDVEIDLTEEQANIIVNILMNPDAVNEDQLQYINEGIIGSMLGGLGGLAFGKSIGKLLAGILGIKENSPLYNVLTSRLVGGAIGTALGKKLKF